ncbi:MAG: hypothetical protein ACK40G_13305 [Cytophagaceae bacterium]
MQGKLLEYGYYELLESVHGRLLLLINDERKYFWERSGEVENLILTDGINEKSGDKEFIVKNHGHFFYISPAIDGKYAGIPRLYLQDRGRYVMFLLATGFPAYNDHIKTIVPTGESVPVEDIDTFALQAIELEKSKGFF